MVVTLMTHTPPPYPGDMGYEVASGLIVLGVYGLRGRRLYTAVQYLSVHRQQDHRD